MTLLEMWERIGKQPLKLTRNTEARVFVDGESYITKCKYQNGKMIGFEAESKEESNVDKEFEKIGFHKVVETDIGVRYEGRFHTHIHAISITCEYGNIFVESFREKAGEEPLTMQETELVLRKMKEMKAKYEMQRL